MTPQPANAPRLTLLIFDLDGTLIDSRADLVDGINAMLTHLGHAPLPDAVVARYVGDGAPLLVQRALGLIPPPLRTAAPEPPPPPLSPVAMEQSQYAVRYFLDYYNAHKLDRTRLYDGVEAGLGELSRAGYSLAVLSNKPVRPSREILEGLGVASRFRAIYGGDSFERKKPDPIGIEALLSECGLEARAALMVGDTSIDIAAGRAAGAQTCGVSYGFMPESLRREPPDWTAESFPALVAHLLAQ